MEGFPRTSLLGWAILINQQLAYSLLLQSFGGRADQGSHMMAYQWDSVPSYRLQYAIVNGFLMELFGNYEFYAQVCTV
jgi:hypothetical protein